MGNTTKTGPTLLKLNNKKQSNTIKTSQDINYTPSSLNDVNKMICGIEEDHKHLKDKHL